MGLFSFLYHIKKYGPLVNHMSFGFNRPHCSPNHDLCLPTWDQCVVGDVEENDKNSWGGLYSIYIYMYSIPMYSLDLHPQ